MKSIVSRRGLNYVFHFYKKARPLSGSLVQLVSPLKVHKDFKMVYSHLKPDILVVFTWLPNQTRKVENQYQCLFIVVFHNGNLTSERPYSR